MAHLRVRRRRRAGGARRRGRGAPGPAPQITNRPPRPQVERCPNLDTPRRHDLGVAKRRTVHRCSECGATAPSWVGRCPMCDAWGTLAEEAESVAAGRRRRHRPADADRSGRPPRRGGEDHRGGRARPGPRRRPGPRVGHAARGRARHREVDAADPGRRRRGPRWWARALRVGRGVTTPGPAAGGAAGRRRRRLVAPGRDEPAGDAGGVRRGATRPRARRLHPDRRGSRARLGSGIGEPGPGLHPPARA